MLRLALYRLPALPERHTALIFSRESGVPMTPTQEINVFMSNGDVAKALLHELGSAYRVDFDYQNSIGPKLDPHAGPMGSAITCFDHMIATVAATGAIFTSSIARVSNPNNAEILSIADQEAVLRARGITAPVELNK